MKCLTIYSQSCWYQISNQLFFSWPTKPFWSSSISLNNYRIWELKTKKTHKQANKTWKGTMEFARHNPKTLETWDLKLILQFSINKSNAFFIYTFCCCLFLTSSVGVTGVVLQDLEMSVHTLYSSWLPEVVIWSWILL